MNENLESKILWKVWKHNAETKPDKDAIVVWFAGEEPYRWTFKNLYAKAEEYAYALRKHGIKKDEVVAIILKHNTEFYPIYMGISLAGAIPAVLAYPNPRLHPDKFRQGIEGMSKRSGLDWIVSERSLEDIISPLIKQDTSTIKGIQFALEWDLSEEKDAGIVADIKETQNSIKSSDPFLLQHSSGTTGLQKPVLLSHRAVLDHVKNYAQAIKFSESDKVASWLPLYHDMGLIAAYHIPLAYGMTQVQIDTFEWVMIPSLLLEVVSKEKATLSWLPNFSYNLMADKIQEEDIEEIGGVSLESWRMLINCSEPVRYESHKKFYERFSKYGLAEHVLATCYAMAETTYAVTQTEPGVDPAFIYADRNTMSTGKIVVNPSIENSRVCVSSGKLVDGCEIKIVDENRLPVEEDNIGEVVIKSVSMFDGYRNYPEKTAEAVQDGWYYSGDFGFKHNDNYYIIGRKKDIIIAAGNNIYPEDVEDTISKIEGVIPGRVVAFGEYDEEIGSEQVSVVAETNISHRDEQKKLKMNILKAGMLMDVSIKKIYLVPARWLIKSSAGKPSRKANKERIINNENIEWTSL